MRKQNKPGTFGSVVDEVKDGTYIDNARRRASRRKSAWNLLLPLAVIPLWMALWWWGVELAWWVHLHFLHHGASPMSGNWMKALGRQQSLAAFLMILPPFLPAISGAMVIGNFLVSLIPPARRAMEGESRDFPGTDYSTAQRSLLRATAVLLGIASVLALIGAATFKGPR